MAEQQTPHDDPITSKSYALHYVIASVLMIGSLFWALWDEAYGQRPWKLFQDEFKVRYGAFLGRLRTQSEESEAAIRKEPEYQKLAQSLEAAQQQSAAQIKEINQKLELIATQIAAVQAVFTEAKARADADTYQAEITADPQAKERKRQQVEEWKNRKQHTVEIPGEPGKQVFDYHQLEEKYNGLKAERSRLTLELADVLKPVNEVRDQAAAYMAERLTTLTPEQIDGLRKKYAEWEPNLKDVQINVAETNVVDRCESCHMGVRQPVALTLASMTVGKEPDAYARAFVGHPKRELLDIHNPDRFGCTPCHGGNGRAASSELKAHGRHKFWLWPLFYKENMEAGCQTCHGGDMMLAKGYDLAETINEGKRLFQVRGCVGCHRYEGYDPEPERLIALNQQVHVLEAQRKDNLRQMALLQKQADAAPDNETAARLNQQALNLRVGVSQIDGRLEQVDLEMRGLMRDQKKVGPNLKDIRAKLRRDWIPVWLHKPSEFRATTKMPNFRLSEPQTKAISAYIWQSSLKDGVPARKTGDPVQGKELLETRGCLGCHSIGEGSAMQGGDFAANLTRLGEKANYDYIVRWILDPKQRLRPYCPFEKKDIGPEDYAKKGLPYVFDREHSKCPNDGHELQVQQMTVMPDLRLTDQEAADIATYLMTQKQKEPSAYVDASWMEDPKLKDEGRRWVRHFGCAGCHEISGFEDEGRIGTELTVEGSKPIERLDFGLLEHPAKAGIHPVSGKAERPWYDHKGFFEHKLAKPDVYDLGKIRGETEKLRMPDPHLTPEQIRALVTFLLGSRDSTHELPLPASFVYRPGDARRDAQEGWWLVRKYNCTGCHQFLPGQPTSFLKMTRYQDPDWKEQLPPQLLTEGARANPDWMLHFLKNPALSETDTARNGVRPYLKARMPTFQFSDNELRKLVRFFQALSQQPMPYIPQRIEALTAKETDMARSLFTSTAAPCLKCHATGDPAHDRTATAPNFLLAKERLKPGWTERWLLDPQAISPGTSMPSGLFRREEQRWVFNGPVPPSFAGFTDDHNKLLVRYIFQLTPEEQRRAGARGLAQTSTPGPVRAGKRTAATGGGSR